MRKKDKIFKKIMIEYVLVSSILITSSLSNDRAEKEKNESSTKSEIEYAQLYTRVEEKSKLSIAEDGSLNILPQTYIYKEAPEGYTVDYEHDIAYKIKKIYEYNELADKMYKYTIIRNSLLSISGILLSSLGVYKLDEEIDKVKKMLLK